NVNYRNFNAALRDAAQLMKADPTSIETVDSQVLNLAMNDIVWHSVADFFPAAGGGKIQGLHLVGYTGDDEDDVWEQVGQLRAKLDQSTAACPTGCSSSEDTGRIGYSVAWGNEAVNKIWGMRKKAVGLLGNVEGEARPLPFVEDTAVPPENLADFI